jgi:DNA polymerase-3 subunit gamma/tau
MIDEVHMLTGHAFNAMLKTLEEPPAHVKFILATTDPQKIPVTVLSRCLQFNLKQMPPDAIVGHLSHVLDAEDMPYETPALRLIGQAARGSMRDALSLTDQAIAFSAGNLTDDAVRSMLGTIDQRHLVRLLDALADGDGAAVLAVADELATRSLSYSGALGDLAVMLSQIAIAQRVAIAAVADDPMGDDLIRLASRLNPDAVQLFYSIAVHSRAELALAPDEYAGFAMACVRMLAFSAEAGGATVPAGTSGITASAAKAVVAPASASVPALATASAPAPAPAPAAAAALPAQTTSPASTQAAASAASSPVPSEGEPAAASAAPAMPETVPTAAPGAILPAVPAAPATPESGAVSLPADSDVQPAEQDADASVAPDMLTPVASNPAAAAVPVPSPAASSAPAQAASATPTRAEAAREDSPPWDQTPDVAPAATRPSPAATAGPAAATPAEAPVNSPRAAMARALAGGPISARAASAAPSAGGQSPVASRPAPVRPTAAPAPTRAPAAAAPPPRPARSNGPPDLEPPPWLMDDAEPSFAAPPSGMPGRRDTPDHGASRPPSRSPDAPSNARSAVPVRPVAPAQPQPSAPSYATSALHASDDTSADTDFADDRDDDSASEVVDDAALATYVTRHVHADAAPDAPADASDASARYTGDPGAAITLDEPWPALAARLPVRGIAAQLARQSELVRVDGNLFVLRVAARTLAEGQGAERLRSVLDAHFGRPVRVHVEVGATGSDTAHAVEQSVRSARQQAAEEAILADPFVRTLMDNFGGQIVPNSISPVSPDLPVKETPK